MKENNKIKWEKLNLYPTPYELQPNGRRTRGARRMRYSSVHHVRQHITRSYFHFRTHSGTLASADFPESEWAAVCGPTHPAPSAAQHSKCREPSNTSIQVCGPTYQATCVGKPIKPRAIKHTKCRVYQGAVCGPTKQAPWAANTRGAVCNPI